MPAEGEGNDRGLINNPNQQFPTGQQQSQSFTVWGQKVGGAPDVGAPDVNNVVHQYSQPSGGGGIPPPGVSSLRSIQPISVSTSGSGNIETSSEVHPTFANVNTICNGNNPQTNFVTENDVLCGRGGGISSNKGNIRYMAMIKNKRLSYQSTKKGLKKEFAQTVVSEWRNQSPPGRFLSEDKVTKRWNDIGDAAAISKVQQSLREKPKSKDNSKKNEATIKNIVVNDQSNNNNVSVRNLQGGKGLQGLSVISYPVFKEGELVLVEDYHIESEDCHITQTVKGGIAKVTKVIETKDNYDDDITTYDVRFVNEPRTAQGVDEIHLTPYKGKSIEPSKDLSTKKRVMKEKPQDEPSAKKVNNVIGKATSSSNEAATSTSATLAVSTASVSTTTHHATNNHPATATSDNICAQTAAAGDKVWQLTDEIVYLREAQVEGSGTADVNGTYSLQGSMYIRNNRETLTQPSSSSIESKDSYAIHYKNLAVRGSFDQVGYWFISMWKGDITDNSAPLVHMYRSQMNADCRVPPKDGWEALYGNDPPPTCQMKGKDEIEDKLMTDAPTVLDKRLQVTTADNINNGSLPIDKEAATSGSTSTAESNSRTKRQQLPSGAACKACRASKKKCTHNNNNTSQSDKVKFDLPILDAGATGKSSQTPSSIRSRIWQ